MCIIFSSNRTQSRKKSAHTFIRSFQCNIYAKYTSIETFQCDAKNSNWIQEPVLKKNLHRVSNISIDLSFRRDLCRLCFYGGQHASNAATWRGTEREWQKRHGKWKRVSEKCCVWIWSTICQSPINKIVILFVTWHLTNSFVCDMWVCVCMRVSAPTLFHSNRSNESFIVNPLTSVRSHLSWLNLTRLFHFARFK